MVLEYKDEIEAATGKKLDNDLDEILSRNKNFTEGFDSTGKIDESKK